MYRIFNFFLFKIYRVSYKQDLTIRGRIYIKGKGEIEIGRGVKINSSDKFNPLGGDNKTRLIARDKTSKLAIGNNVGISNSTLFCTIEIKIEENVLIGNGCKLWDTDFHSIKPQARIYGGDNEVKNAPIHVKKNAFIGGCSIILKGVEIGENSVIAAGSVVTKKIPPNEIWGGNPAKFIRKL